MTDENVHGKTYEDITNDRDNHNHLGRDNSEFTLVIINDRSKVSREFGLQCIGTISELNKRIANVSTTTVDQPFELHVGLSGDEPDGGRKDLLKDVDVNHAESCPIVNSNVSNVMKPLLVELHSFPGFDEDEQTPLPSHLSVLFILKTITEGQMDLERKPSFKKVFNDFFLSSNSQGILEDSFWWYFCHKYQPSATSQEKLFDRIAKKYTNLLVSSIGSIYQDKLFKDYANLMSQAIYSTFCHAFPASYLQFNMEFCDDILSLMHLWMTGIKFLPRMWEKWNFKAIEPKGIHKRASINDVKTRHKMQIKLEVVEKNPSATSPDDTRELSKDATKNKSLLLKSPLIRSVSHMKKSKNKDSVANFMQQISSVLHGGEKTKKRNSCAAEGGPTFQKVVFDLYGRSPLVEHVLTSHRLLKDAGMAILVQRTEIEKLPPLCADTYKDVIENVRCKSRQLLKNYRVTSAHREREYKDIVNKHKVDQNIFFECTEKLLSNPQEVRKLSALLRADERNDDQIEKCSKIFSFKQY